MSTEEIPLLFTVKKEYCSDDEEDSSQYSGLNHCQQTSTNRSIKNNIKVQTLSYLDIENIKEESDSENEDFIYEKHIQLDNSSNNINQIVKIKEEDEYEFRIVELISLKNEIEDNNRLDSIVEFEDEQKTSFRIEDLNNYEDQGSIDATESQRISLNQFSMKPRIKPSNIIDGNPKLDQSKLEKQNLILHASNRYIQDVSNRNLVPHQDSLSTNIKQEPNDDDSMTSSSVTHLTAFDVSKVITENFIQKEILQNSSKIYEEPLKFDKTCYQKFANLSNILKRSTQNEKLMSRILLKNTSNSPPQQKAIKMQIISKTIRLDKTDLTELPTNVMEKFNLQKHSVNFEKKEGQVINMFKVPYYVCTTCLTVFDTQNNFFMHYKTLHATVEKPFDCWKCVTSFCTWKDLLTHLKCHDEIRSFSCKYCFHPFKFKETLEKHLKTVHVEKVENMSCNVCGRNFDSEKDLLVHSNRHARATQIVINGDRMSTNAVQRNNSIKCIFCPEQFFKNEKLEEHYKTHKALVPMKCRSCGKDVMINPQYIIKNIKMREFKCVECLSPIGYQKSNSEKGSSVSITNGLVKIEKKLEQKASSSKTATTVKLNEPSKLMTKNQERNKMLVKCNVCGIEVGSNVKLFWHMKKHVDKNEFQCSVCHKDFDSREAMVEHCKTQHSTTNVTKCKICNKEFHFVDLETHMKMHRESTLESSSTQTSSFSPKIIRLNSKGEATSSNQIKSNTIDKRLLFGANCPTCKDYVLHTNFISHNQKHDKEKTLKLVQNIQNRRKQEGQIKNSNSDLGNDVKSFKGRKIILKRKPEENNEGEVVKRIKVEQ
ncbi:unnamed protein product [Chironomus riparius]|uniref:C2H2-type domain-containing protein n=1 Tax=Chironomus riparius TaxID=315576 RepID=A0A9N9SA70_9DIPT|nr:unnamed protein product [Chironomus riparius]